MRPRTDGWTELHRHLDISMRLSTLLEMAQVVGVEAPETSLEGFRRRMVISRPLASLSEVLDSFGIVQRVLDRPEHLERVAFETVQDCHAEGTRAVELRFSPSFVCDLSGLAWGEALAAFRRGIDSARLELPDIRVGLLCIASRDFGTDAVAETIEFYLHNVDGFVGFDLAGKEEGYPCRMFEAAFEPLRRAKREAPQKVHVTIHAGEAAGPESVWEAIELLGAERIGHGIHSFDDPELVRYLAERQICLEMCPTSNWLTGAVPSLDLHPLKRALDEGVAASINTDDPTLFGVSLEDEVRVAREVIGLTSQQIEHSFQVAAAATFLPDGEG